MYPIFVLVILLVKEARLPRCMTFLGLRYQGMPIIVVAAAAVVVVVVVVIIIIIIMIIIIKIMACRSNLMDNKRKISTK